MGGKKKGLSITYLPSVYTYGLTPEPQVTMELKKIAWVASSTVLICLLALQGSNLVSALL